MKFTQIATTSIGPYTHANGTFCWGETILFALDADGNIWRNDVANFDNPRWVKIAPPSEMELHGAT